MSDATAAYEYTQSVQTTESGELELSLTFTSRGPVTDVAEFLEAFRDIVSRHLPE
ncbi:hypothetical protein ACOKGD_13915 [Microbacterium phosphatis]|uniref:hypothetical protein n=1 Tax=Microbacterium phosphatis TaxID=3140248 RepID=UPI00314088B5